MTLDTDYSTEDGNKSCLDSDKFRYALDDRYSSMEEISKAYAEVVIRYDLETSLDDDIASMDRFREELNNSEEVSGIDIVKELEGNSK